MRVGRRAGAAGAMVVLLVLAVPSAAEALAITVPSQANLGAVPSGTKSLSQNLGAVTVTDSGFLGLFPSFLATVSASSFTSGGQTIPTTSISYWSGTATATSGLQTPVPGQVGPIDAVNLSSSQTAFSSTGLALSITTTWNPTIVISIPAAAVAGTYSGTITHSVA